MPFFHRRIHTATKSSILLSGSNQCFCKGERYEKKITNIILAVCLVVAGLPLFAIGARANDDANTNSEMMISVDNYFDYRNAKLMTASFGAGYTADSMDYPALVCNDVEAPAMAMEAKTNTDLRTSGMMDYFESCKLHLLSWEAFTGEPQDITTMENGLVSCKVYEWVEYTWYSDDFLIRFRLDLERGIH